MEVVAVVVHAGKDGAYLNALAVFVIETSVGALNETEDPLWTEGN